MARIRDGEDLAHAAASEASIALAMWAVNSGRAGRLVQVMATDGNDGAYRWCLERLYRQQVHSSDPSGEATAIRTVTDVRMELVNAMLGGVDWDEFRDHLREYMTRAVEEGLPV